MKTVIYLLASFCLLQIIQAKDNNLVIINSFHDKVSAHHAITGIYAVHGPEEDRNLRGNSDIDWGKNLIRRPVAFGKLASLKLYYSSNHHYDIKIEFEGTDANGSPLLYFHRRALLHENGYIVHHWITASVDGSSPWDVFDKVNRNEIYNRKRKAEKEYHE